MGKVYERPQVSEMKDCAFEIVCAGSGETAGTCPYGRKKVNSGKGNGEVCFQCLTVEHPVGDLLGKGHKEVQRYLQNGGACYAGYTQNNGHK